MDKNDIIIVTGMTGVGKDFLVDAAVNNLPVNKIGWGDMLSKELNTNKDTMMDTVDSQKILDGQFAVCRKVLRMEPLVAVCHVIKPEKGKFVYNLQIEKMLNPSCYVFITAPAEIISERIRERNSSGKRKSSEMSINEIDDTQKIKLQAVKQLADLQGCKLIILNNIEEETAANIQKLKDTVHTLNGVKANKLIDKRYTQQ